MSLQLIGGVCNSLPSMAEQWDSLSAFACLSIQFCKGLLQFFLDVLFQFLSLTVGEPLRAPDGPGRMSYGQVGLVGGG